MKRILVHASLSPKHCWPAVTLYVDKYEVLQRFLCDHHEMHVEFSEVSEEASEASWRLFCKIVDRIVEAQSGRVTKGEHRTLRHQIMAENRIEPKQWMECSRDEMWRMTQTALDWACEAGAYTKDLEGYARQTKETSEKIRSGEGA